MKYFITAAAAAAALAVMGVGIWLSMGGLWWRAVVYAALCIIFFPLASILHELGHKFFGLFGGMKVKLGKFALFTPSSCAIAPKSAKHIKCDFVLTACGGLVVNLLFAAAGIVCLFFGKDAALASFIAPSSLYLLMINAAPTGLGSDATDMQMIASVVKNTAEWQVLERALTIQGMIACGIPIEEIDEKTFFSVPQIPEYEPAFIMLVSLRADYYAAKGEEENAKKWSERFAGLKNDYL